MTNISNKSILIVGKVCNQNSIENFYYNAFKSEGLRVYKCDFNSLTPKIGFVKKLKLFIKSISIKNLDLDYHEENKQLAIEIVKINPTYIMVFTNTPVNCNTLMYVKSLNHEIKLIYYWADTIMNLKKPVIDSATFYDLLGVHSHKLIVQFLNLGFQNCLWVPFGIDQIHITEERSKKYDIGFLGSYSEEREEVLKFIVQEFPNLKIGISGDGWQYSKNKNIKKYIVGKSILGVEYSQFLSSCIISLNIISELSYPSTNMRFFELLTSHSIQLTSFSLEQSSYFIDEKDLFYFRNTTELKEKINKILNLNNNERTLILNNAKTKAINSATYQHRVKLILSKLNNRK